MLSIRSLAKIKRRQEKTPGSPGQRTQLDTEQAATPLEYTEQAAAPEAAAPAEPSCPSPYELWQRRFEFWQSFVEQVGEYRRSLWELRDLFSFAALLWLMGWVLRGMLDYLSAEYNVDLPSVRACAATMLLPPSLLRARTPSHADAHARTVTIECTTTTAHEPHSLTRCHSWLLWDCGCCEDVSTSSHHKLASRVHATPLPLSCHFVTTRLAATDAFDHRFAL